MQLWAEDGREPRPPERLAGWLPGRDWRERVEAGPW